jgi:asparagine synthase (glutamine-hydrolysing)
VIVVNGGQGGDEAWGGYFGYIPAYLRTLVSQARRHSTLAGELLGDALTLLRRPDLRSSLTRAFRAGRRGRLQAASTLGPWAGDLFSDYLQSPAAHHLSPTESAPSGARPSALGAVMRYDLQWYLPALLQVEDRTSMAFSLESRAPLLDYRLLEHAATVPAPLRMKGLQLKHILREATADLLPRSVYRRTDKKGMPTPVAPWFRGPLAPWLRSTLASHEIASAGLFSPLYVESALQEHISGRRDRSLDLWKLLSVLSWWRTYITSPQSPAPVETHRREPVAIP